MSMNDFKVLSPLGKGAFASVSKVERKSDGKIYALKRVNISKMSKREVADAVNEIRVLASVRHPHIVSFLQAFLDKGDSELCIIMEFCGCGDLAQKVDRYKKRKQNVDERVIWAYLIQMADALKHLHAKHIVHRDLKTANCFLSEDGSIKIGDLNVSKAMKNGLLQTQIGTPYYMSPEIWANRPYDASCDLWALGCTLYELAALRPPFLGDSFPQLKKAVQSGKYPALPKVYSQDLVQVLSAMIKVNPRERPTAAQLLDMPAVALRRKSDWFTKLPSHEVVGDVQMQGTIKVPQQLHRLKANLPQPCYPEARPHSPEAWPATDRHRSDAIEAKAQNPLMNKHAQHQPHNQQQHQHQCHQENSAPQQPPGTGLAPLRGLHNKAPQGVEPSSRRPLGTRQPNMQQQQQKQQPYGQPTGNRGGVPGKPQRPTARPPVGGGGRARGLSPPGRAYVPAQPSAYAPQRPNYGRRY